MKGRCLQEVHIGEVDVRRKMRDVGGSSECVGRGADVWKSSALITGVEYQCEESVGGDPGEAPRLVRLGEFGGMLRRRAN